MRLIPFKAITSNLMRGRERRYHARDIALGQPRAHRYIVLISIPTSSLGSALLYLGMVHHMPVIFLFQPCLGLASSSLIPLVASVSFLGSLSLSSSRRKS